MGVVGAASLTEGSLTEKSRGGKTNLRIQPMSWHNKAHFLSQPQSQAGSAWILPRDLSEDHPEQSQGALEMQAEERERHLQGRESLGKPGTTCKWESQGGEDVFWGPARGGCSQMWRQMRTWFGFFQRWHLGVLRVWAAPSQNALKGSRLEQRPSEELQGSLLPRASLAVQSVRNLPAVPETACSVGGLGSIPESGTIP